MGSSLVNSIKNELKTVIWQQTKNMLIAMDTGVASQIGSIKNEQIILLKA